MLLQEYRTSITITTASRKRMAHVNQEFQYQGHPHIPGIFPPFNHRQASSPAHPQNPKREIGSPTLAIRTTPSVPSQPINFPFRCEIEMNQHTPERAEVIRVLGKIVPKGWEELGGVAG